MYIQTTSYKAQGQGVSKENGAWVVVFAGAKDFISNVQNSRLEVGVNGIQMQTLWKRVYR